MITSGMRPKASKKLGASITLEAVGIAISLIFLIPLYFIVINAFKPFGEIMLSFVTFPKTLYLDNIKEAFRTLDYAHTFFNSLVTTVGGVFGIVFLSSMAAWKLARTKTRFSKLLYYYLTLSMVVPFFSIMIPLVQRMFSMGLGKSRIGLLLVYWAIGTSFAVFLLHGFVSSVPAELEESARLDGCNDFKVFFLIVFPLLKPTIGTLVVLDSLWIWNDFLVPMLLIYLRKDLRTIPLATYNFFGENVQRWNLAIAGVLLSIIPCIIFFIFMQRYIVKGITSGAVKG